MCFSATASFSMSFILALLGCLALYKVQKANQYFFACIPLLFALQQFAEGLTWLSFTHVAYQDYQTLSIYMFLVFAMLIWPIWMPLSLRVIEKQEDKWIQLSFCFLAGLMFSTQIFFWLIKNGASAHIHNHHILYTLGVPNQFYFFGILLYGIAAVLPFFLSSHKKMWIFGTALLGSYIVSYIYFTKTLLSIWCFFAALLSALIPFILI